MKLTQLIRADLASFAVISGLSFALLNQIGCGTSTGNPRVTLSTGSYVSRQWYDFMVPSAYASVSQITLCFKRLRFKSAEKEDSSNKDEDPDNQDFKIGQVTLASTGNSLGSVNLAAGIYRRIEFDLDNHCASGKSISITNDNGSFQTDQSISFSFEGNFVLTGGDKTIVLDFQTIIAQLNSVSSNSAIKDTIETTKGGFHEHD